MAGAGAGLDFANLTIPFGASTISSLLNFLRKSMPSKMSVLCGSMIIRPTCSSPSKCTIPRHVSFVCVVPSARVMGTVPCNINPTGKA